LTSLIPWNATDPTSREVFVVSIQLLGDSSSLCEDDAQCVGEFRTTASGIACVVLLLVTTGWPRGGGS
jgi:hypothetical protein